MKRYKKRGQTIGFVPTMGALHEGHLSLVRAARKECDRVVVSIFVNPTQFGPNEDFHRYPRVFSKDRALLQKEKVDLLFFPSVKTIYPDLFATEIDVGPISEPLCGKFRPGHFRGVATVCAKLFNLVQPDKVYFGQKDYQQTRVIAQLLKDLNLPIAMRVLPTVREKDGLAMSSRNRTLADGERKKALSLSRALFLGRQMIQSGEKDPQKIRSRMRALLRASGVRHVDYVSLVDPERLGTVARVRGKVLLAIAAWVGKTRLIDNLTVSLRNSKS